MILLALWRAHTHRIEIEEAYREDLKQDDGPLSALGEVLERWLGE